MVDGTDAEFSSQPGVESASISCPFLLCRPYSILKLSSGLCLTEMCLWIPFYSHHAADVADLHSQRLSRAFKLRLPESADLTSGKVLLLTVVTRGWVQKRKRDFKQIVLTPPPRLGIHLSGFQDETEQKGALRPILDQCIHSDEKEQPWIPAKDIPDLH